MDYLYLKNHLANERFAENHLNFRLKEFNHLQKNTKITHLLNLSFWIHCFSK
jgi:hypothetical protein